MKSELLTSTMTSHVSSQFGAARRRKSRKNSRVNQRRPRPSPSTPKQTGTGSSTLSTAHVTDYVHEITLPTFGHSAASGRSRVPEKRRRPLNQKLTTATNQQTRNSSAASSGHLSPMATAVPYVNVGEVTRRGYVTSGQLAWDETGVSLATVVGLATVSVLAFWLIVTIIVLSCLLARTKMAAEPRTGCVADSRWSWSGNQLIGLLDDSLDAPPEHGRRFSAERFDLSPLRWNSTAGVSRRRDSNQTLTAYRLLRQRSSAYYDRPPAPSSELLDSGYDTLAAAAAILDEPDAGDTPEVTSHTMHGHTDVWTRQRVPTVSGFSSCLQHGCVRSTEVSSRRRFPKMGQSCLQRASSYLRPFTDTAPPARSDGVDHDGRPRLAGYTTLPPSDTTIDIGTTAV